MAFRTAGTSLMLGAASGGRRRVKEAACPVTITVSAGAAAEAGQGDVAVEARRQDR